jgi:hypothetical protein
MPHGFRLFLSAMVVFGLSLLVFACSDSSGTLITESPENSSQNSESGGNESLTSAESSVVGETSAISENHTDNTAGTESSSPLESVVSSEESIVSSEESAQSPEPTVFIVGSWLSTGANIAKLLKDTLKVTEIKADFSANGSYKTIITVEGTRVKGLAKGSYSVDTSTTPHKIHLHQDSMNGDTTYTGDFDGIYQIDESKLPAKMRYEVVMTNPPTVDDKGNTITAPTPAGGFGSSGDGAYGMDNVQTYVRQ